MNTKIFFTILFGFLILLMFFGSEKLTGFSERTLVSLQILEKTFEYKINVSQGQGLSLLASVGEAFKYTDTEENRDNFYVKNNVQSIPVLLYHGIVEKEDRFSLTPDRFAEHMLTLHKAGYSTITAEQFRDFMQGKIVLSGKPLLITFDDGRKDSFYGAPDIIRVGMRVSCCPHTGGGSGRAHPILPLK